MAYTYYAVIGLVAHKGHIALSNLMVHFQSKNKPFILSSYTVSGHYSGEPARRGFPLLSTG